MACGALHVFQAAPVFEGSRDERGSHGVGRVAAVEADAAGELADDAVDCVGVHVPTRQPLLAVVVERAKHRAVKVFGVARRVEVGADSLSRLRVDRKRVLLGSLPRQAKRIEPAVLVQSARCRCPRGGGKACVARTGLYGELGCWNPF